MSTSGISLVSTYVFLVSLKNFKLRQPATFWIFVTIPFMVFSISHIVYILFHLDWLTVVVLTHACALLHCSLMYRYFILSNHFENLPTSGTSDIVVYCRACLVFFLIEIKVIVSTFYSFNFQTITHVCGIVECSQCTYIHSRLIFSLIDWLVACGYFSIQCCFIVSLQLEFKFIHKSSSLQNITRLKYN